MRSLAIARSELRRFFRDRTALFFTLALPFVLILVVGSATSGFDDDTYPVGVVRLADGDLSGELVSALDEGDQLDVETYDDRLELARAVRRGIVPAGIVIGADYDTTLLNGDDATVELLLDQTRGNVAAARALISEVVSDQGAVLQAAIFAADKTGGDIGATRVRAAQIRDGARVDEVVVTTDTIGEAGDRDYLPPGIGYQAPSNLILFVFITSLAGSSLLIQSRQLKVMQRMYSTPTSASAIIFGEGLARFVIAAGQALFIFGVGALIFDVDWGQPLGAAALITTFVLVGTSVGLLLGSLLSTPEQAGTVGPMAGIAMGMLGGCMWPLEIVPQPMRILGHVFPHAWAMDAWIDLIGRGGSISDITTELAVLAGFVAVILPLGTWRLRRALVA